LPWSHAVSLLEEIQRDAVDSNADLGAVLRKCKILAARLGSRSLEDWLVSEASGYPTDAALPDYRILPLQLKGHFSGPFGSGMRNAPIPFLCVPKELRNHFERFECRQSIASIESLIRDGKSGTLDINTGDLAVFLGANVYRGQNCVQAWGEIGKAGLVEVVNAARNKVLDFALALWKEEPGAGEAATPKDITIGAARVTQIFNTTVYGGSTNLVGSAQNSTLNFAVSQGDFSSLSRGLAQLGIAGEDIAELRTALSTDGCPEGSQRFGPRVAGWIGKMVKKAAEGAWNIGIDAAGSVLGSAIGKYYGWNG